MFSNKVKSSMSSMTWPSPVLLLPPTAVTSSTTGAADSCGVGVGVVWRPGGATVATATTSLIGDGERDLVNKPAELLRLGTGDFHESGWPSLTTATTLGGRGSSLWMRLLAAGSHSFVFSRLMVDVAVVVAFSNDDRILEMLAVPPVGTAGGGAASALADSTAGPSIESERKRERAFLTTDGLPSTGLATDNRLPLLFNGDVADSAPPSVGAIEPVVMTDNFFGRSMFSSRRALSATTCSVHGSSSTAGAGPSSSATPFVCGATGSFSSPSSLVFAFWTGFSSTGVAVAV